MVDIRNQIYTDIESQFPAIYREDGEVFVAFVQSYYEYLDLRANSFRDATIIRDIDTTYDRFLAYFKEKYLKGFPIPDTLDVRFLVKHIQDFYRRKGTEESLRLLFRIFFDEEIEVFYPSSAILKPSDSKYGSSSYIELKRVDTYKDYPVRRGDRIRGSVSKAAAFVDELIFLTIEGVIVPIAYLSNLNGSFIADDSIEIYRQGSTDAIFTGKIVYGSISNIIVNTENRTSNNKLGEVLKIRSSLYGKDATCIVTSISETPTGVIEFNIKDGGWGYSANSQIIDLYTSNQVLVLDNDENGTVLSEFDTLSATNSAITPIDSTSDTVFTETITGSAQVIKYEHPLIYLNTTSNDAFNIIPFGGKTEITINGNVNNKVTVTNIASFNDSASYEIAEISDIESVILITDIIGDFTNIALDNSNYGMSGAGVETLSTTLRDAFIPVSFEIGGIKSLKILDEGIEYKNDVASIIIQDDILKFDKKDIGIIFDRSDFTIQRGDIITQDIVIEDLTYQSSTVPYTVKAKFIRRDSDVYYFTKLSFYDFDNDYPVRLKNNNYGIVDIIQDEDSIPMGKNANVTGNAKFRLGQVESVKVLDTGFRYRDGETVELLNSNDEVVATANLEVKGQGGTESSWKTTTSFLNDPTKLIRDNFYYQEYSFDISTILTADKYEDLVKNIVQVAGTKQFSSSLINSVNNFQPSIDMSLELFGIIEVPLAAEENNQTIDTLGATENNIITGDLVASVETLDESTVQVYIALES